MAQFLRTNKVNNMKIKSGNYDIHSAGTVISYENEPVTFYLAVDLIVKLLFKDDDTKKEHAMEFNLIENHTLEILLINFNNSLGTGNTNPLRVGTLNNRYVYLNFRVHLLDIKTNRTVHYTWYLGEEVQHA
jgi:hypothetical protein